VKQRSKHNPDQYEEYSLEPYIPGEFVRINNNLGIIVGNKSVGSEWIEIAQAFSYYTYIISNQKVMVADIQGWIQPSIRNGPATLLLTDPAIHNLHAPGAYGSTDMGVSGIREFLKSYRFEQNRFHIALGLPPIDRGGDEEN